MFVSLCFGMTVYIAPDRRFGTWQRSGGSRTRGCQRSARRRPSHGASARTSPTTTATVWCVPQLRMTLLAPSTACWQTQQAYCAQRIGHTRRCLHVVHSWRPCMVVPIFCCHLHLLLLTCCHGRAMPPSARVGRKAPLFRRFRICTARAAAQVHEHCWTVVRWAILAIGSGDSASRMLRFYARLLEHFMGVDPRTPEEVFAPATWLPNTYMMQNEATSDERAVFACVCGVDSGPSMTDAAQRLRHSLPASRDKASSQHSALCFSQLAAPEEKDERKAATEAERAKRAIKARKKGRVSALVAEAADGAETDPESAATPVGSVAKAVLANGDGTGDDGAASKVGGPLLRHGLDPC